MWSNLAAHWRPLLFTGISIVAACWPAWFLMDRVRLGPYINVPREAIRSATLDAILWMSICAGVTYWLHTRRLKRRTWSGQLSELLMWLLYLYLALYAVFLYISIPQAPDPSKVNEPFFGVVQLLQLLSA